MLLLANSLHILLSFTIFLSIIKISYMEDIDENIVKQKILQKILDHFQLEKPLTVDVSSKVRKKYEAPVNKMDDWDEVKKPVTFFEIPSKKISSSTIFFNIPKILRAYLFQEAFLKLDYYSNANVNINETFNGEIYIITDKNELLESIGNVTFGGNSSSNGTLNVPLDVNLLSKIINSDDTNLNIYIKVHKTKINISYSFNFASIKFHSVERKERKKRSNENICQSKSSETSCCLRSLKINFDEIGWNFIISPKEINTNYCYGKCISYKSDSLVGDAIYRLHSLNKKEHKSCCYPTQFRELNITIFKEGSFIETKIINDILIKKCSCY
uniref:TGF_BETA_2 domain-containing protein n=1 Tax=Strongyloides venezuelensis TaxID=75913 RepID=A0A0K0FAB1_STRVS